MRNEKRPTRVICHSYLQETSTVLQPGECVVLPHGTMLQYLSINSETKIRTRPNSSVFIALSRWLEEQGPPPSNTPNTAPSSAINSPLELRRDTRAPNGRANGTQPPPPPHQTFKKTQILYKRYQFFYEIYPSAKMSH